MIRKYRKKPVVVEAVRLTQETFGDIVSWIGINGISQLRAMQPVCVVIRTLEGKMLANDGDYIIKGVNGEFYPCKQEIFDKTYEVAE